MELNIVERASDNTIGRTLKKNLLKPHLQKTMDVIPLDANAAFVANMEDVLAFIIGRTIQESPPWSCRTRYQSNLIRPARVCADQGEARTARTGMTIMSMSGMEPPICS